VLQQAAEYFVDLDEEKVNIGKDIQAYLRQRMERDRILRRWDPQTRQIVMDQLAADSGNG
jgi:hypothetical protein